MAKIDGLIIPRSYNDYINKSDPQSMSEGLQLAGVMDDAPTQNSVKPAKSGGIYTAVDRCQKQNAFSEITTLAQIENIDENTLKVNQNNMIVSGIKIGVTENIYGTAYINRRGYDISVIIFDTVHNYIWANVKNNGTWGTWRHF